MILVGVMGSGKTAVGGYLARELGWEFIDTDLLVEKQAGKTIAELFESEGEEAFRELEERVVIDSLGGVSGRGRVVSLGGGAVTSDKVASRLDKEPLVFLLDIDVETAFRRSRTGTRPLVQDRAGFSRLLAARQQAYTGHAKFIVDTRGKGIKVVAGEIIEVIGRSRGAGLA